MCVCVCVCVCVCSIWESRYLLNGCTHDPPGSTQTRQNTSSIDIIPTMPLKNSSTSLDQLFVTREDVSLSNIIDKQGNRVGCLWVSPTELLAWAPHMFRAQTLHGIMGSWIRGFLEVQLWLQVFISCCSRLVEWNDWQFRKGRCWLALGLWPEVFV